MCKTILFFIQNCELISFTSVTIWDLWQIAMVTKHHNGNNPVLKTFYSCFITYGNGISTDAYCRTRLNQNNPVLKTIYS